MWDELAKRFPPGIAYAMHYDTTRFVSASMRDVLITLGEALVLVVIVVRVAPRRRRRAVPDPQVQNP